MSLGFRQNGFYAAMGGFRIYPRLADGKVLFKAVLLAERWIERARERRALAQLDDRALSDIGLSRSDAANEAGKMFWRE